jgi:hypothetical protein
MNNLEILINASPQLAAFRSAVGTALNHQQQMHVSAQLANLAAWLGTDIGKIAMQTFVQDWIVDHARTNPKIPP